MELIVLVGVPASGKSSLSEHYARLGYCVLSSDKIRAEMRAGDPAGDTPPHGRVFEQINIQARAALSKGQSVLVDATNLGRRRRMTFLRQFARIGCTRRCMLLITPVPVCLRRNAHRPDDARVAEEDMHRMIGGFECPVPGEGWDEIVPVVCPEPYRAPLELMAGFEQDNPYHSRTLEGHTQAVVEHLNANGHREQLQRVGRYHDVGKLFTKSFINVHGERMDHAHYRGHENYGAYLYLTERCCGRTLAPAEFTDALYETALINCHMRPLVQWGVKPALRAQDAALFGEQFVADLTALHEADRAGR